MRGVKMNRSSRKSYGDNAIGYVQIKREDKMCILLAKVTPEHKIKSKNYTVSCKIEETQQKIEEVKCHDCAASEGGCKHAVAFLMWLHRRSEEPSPTETVCYWKKSRLAGAPTNKRFITTADFGVNKVTLTENEASRNSLSEYISEARKHKIKNNFLAYNGEGKFHTLSLFSLFNAYKGSNKAQMDADHFISFCKINIKESDLKDVEKQTRDQSKCLLWSEIRFAKITASKAYEAARCSTVDGSLIESIFGAKIFQTNAMTRDLSLETFVLEELSKQTKMQFSKAGIFLSREFPILGASPDAINNDYVVEIKCPISQNTVDSYIGVDGEITIKFWYQIQIQMLLAKRKKAIFVVASPDFEKTKKITVKYYDFDNVAVEGIINKIRQLWCEAVFNKLK